MGDEHGGVDQAPNEGFHGVKWYPTLWQDVRDFGRPGRVLVDGEADGEGAGID
jgi:hypothetical protein